MESDIPLNFYMYIVYFDISPYPEKQKRRKKDWTDREKLFLTMVFINPEVYSYTQRHALSRGSPGALTPNRIFSMLTGNVLD